jgi:hypothetical protein
MLCFVVCFEMLLHYYWPTRPCVMIIQAMTLTMHKFLRTFYDTEVRVYWFRVI